MVILNGNIATEIHLFIKCLPWYPGLTLKRYDILGSFWCLSTRTEWILGLHHGFPSKPLEKTDQSLLESAWCVVSVPARPQLHTG